MRWDRESWVKLYRREEGSFALLPLYARALAGELLKFADEAGRIYVGAREPWEAIAKLCGATTGDRRLLRQHVPMLIEDRYLVADGEYLVVRNLAKAQRRTKPEPTTSEPGTNEREHEATDERTDNEPARVATEPETKSGASAGDGSDLPLAGARALLDPKREEERRSDPQAPSAGSALPGVGGSGVVEVVPLPPVKLNPVSTAILDAFKASKTLHVVATAQFAIQIAAYVDESGQMPAGRDLADVLAALRQADESEVRDRAIGEDARNQRALAGLVLSKVKKSRRGDSERAKAADSPHGTVSTSGIVHGPVAARTPTPHPLMATAPGGIPGAANG
jgi:hypothetical protein